MDLPVPSVTGSLAFRAYAQEFKAHIEDLETTRITDELPNRRRRPDHDILKPPTASTSNMMMGSGHVVEPPLNSGQIQALDGSLRRQGLQVSVNRTQTDAGQPAPNTIVNLIRRRMRSRRAQFVEDHAPLNGHARISLL